MIKCQEIEDYLEYVKKHPGWINKKRRLLIKNIVMPTLKREVKFLRSHGHIPVLHFKKIAEN